MMPRPFYAVEFVLGHTLLPAIVAGVLNGLEPAQGAIQAVMRDHAVVHTAVNEAPVDAMKSMTPREAQE